MTTTAHVNNRLVGRDISERLGIWTPDGRWQIVNAINEHGADLVWGFVDDAIHLERVTGTSRRTVFFDVLRQYRQERWNA